MSVHRIVAEVTARIVQRSAPYRAAYLSRLEAARRAGVQRGSLSCTNLAHGFAAFPANDKLKLKQSSSSRRLPSCRPTTTCCRRISR